MLSKSKQKSCGHESDIVSYIYDELPQAERYRFEQHLADCAACIDQFAAVSYSRLSVFEYQKQEFSPLATPVIRIPFETRDARARGGSAGTLSTLIGHWRPVFAVAALIAVVSVFLIMDRGRTAETPGSAAVIPAPVPLSQTPPAGPPQAADTMEPIVSTVSSRRAFPKMYRNAVSAKPTRPAQQHSVITTRSQTVAVNPTPATVRAPRLSTYDDTEDRSLRLADLFENEVGVR